MMKSTNGQFIHWAEKLRDIAAYGLTFCKNPYDLENYKKIQDIAIEMTAMLTNQLSIDFEPIRKTILGRPTPLIVVDAAIINENNELLLIRRTDNKEWSLPGGYLDVGETPAEGIEREVMEEVGIQVKPIQLVGVFDTRRLRNGPLNQVTTIIFLCKPITDNNLNLAFENDIEILDKKWCSKATLVNFEMDPFMRLRAVHAFRSITKDFNPYFDNKYAQKDNQIQNDYSITRTDSEDNYIKKFLFTSQNQKATFETASFFTPARNLHDICVSTMAGCPLKCTICSTTHSSLPFERNLTVDEICMQVQYALQERKDIKPDTILRVGFMGNGEPFANFKNMIKAIQKMIFEDGVPIGEIAVSTVGVNIHYVKDLVKIMHDIGIGIKLQLSLYSMNEETRRGLLPMAPHLESIISYLDWYAEISQIPVRYNVPLIFGKNNTLSQLEILRDFLLIRPQYRRLKLSAFNNIPGLSFRPCSDEEILRTSEWFQSQGVKVDLFLGNRDDNVYASCGQLRSSKLIL